MTRTVKIISQVGYVILLHVLVHKVSPEEPPKCQKETNGVAHIRRGCGQDNFTSLSSPSQAEESSLASRLTWQWGGIRTIQ